MNEQENEVILKKLRFFDYWVLPESEIQARNNEIDGIIAVFRESDPKMESLLSNQVISRKIEFAHILAILKPVNNENLKNFVLGIIELAYQCIHNDETRFEKASNLMSGSLKIVSAFYKSEEYKEFLVSDNIAGEERFESKGIIVPFSVNNLMLHIKRMGIHPLNRKDIATVKSDFANFNRSMYYQEKDKAYKTSYIIKDLPVIDEIYEISKQYGIIKVGINDFLEAVLHADFSKIEQKPKYKIQHLVYVLSGVMAEEWYDAVLVSVGWKKSQCGGNGKKLEHDIWGRKINKIFDQIGKIR